MPRRCPAEPSREGQRRIGKKQTRQEKITCPRDTPYWKAQCQGTKKYEALAGLNREAHEAVMSASAGGWLILHVTAPDITNPNVLEPLMERRIRCLPELL